MLNIRIILFVFNIVMNTNITTHSSFVGEHLRHRRDSLLEKMQCSCLCRREKGIFLKHNSVMNIKMFADYYLL